MTPPPAVPLRADAQRNRARILDAAERVFAESGPSGSTEEVARRAGVAVGTVFRHFPTKDDLLGAIMKRILAQLVEEADVLARADESGTALYAFFGHLVDRAASTRTVVDLLARTGVDIDFPAAVGHLERAVDGLLARARTTGTVAADVHLPEVMALLVSVCQGAVSGGWSRELRDRTLSIVFAGLRAGRGKT